MVFLLLQQLGAQLQGLLELAIVKGIFTNKKKQENKKKNKQKRSSHKSVRGKALVRRVTVDRVNSTVP